MVTWGSRATFRYTPLRVHVKLWKMAMVNLHRKKYLLNLEWYLYIIFLFYIYYIIFINIICAVIRLCFVHWRRVSSGLTLHYDWVRRLHYMILDTLLNDHRRLSHCNWGYDTYINTHYHLVMSVTWSWTWTVISFSYRIVYKYAQKIYTHTGMICRTRLTVRWYIHCRPLFPYL